MVPITKTSEEDISEKIIWLQKRRRISSLAFCFSLFLYLQLLCFQITHSSLSTLLRYLVKRGVQVGIILAQIDIHVPFLFKPVMGPNHFHGNKKEAYGTEYALRFYQLYPPILGFICRKLYQKDSFIPKFQGFKVPVSI